MHILHFYTLYNHTTLLKHCTAVSRPGPHYSKLHLPIAAISPLQLSLLPSPVLHPQGGDLKSQFLGFQSKSLSRLSIRSWRREEVGGGRRRGGRRGGGRGLCRYLCSLGCAQRPGGEPTHLSPLRFYQLELDRARDWLKVQGVWISLLVLRHYKGAPPAAFYGCQPSLLVSSYIRLKQLNLRTDQVHVDGSAADL